MAFVTVSTWKIDENMDRATLVSETEQNMGRIKGMGAERAYFVQTGRGEAIAIAVYPDEATRDRIREAVLEIRAKAERDHSAKVTGEMAGEVLVAV